MSTMAEMAVEYRRAAVKIRMKISEMESTGASQQEIKAYRNILIQLRDTEQLLSGYYDAPRHSQNAAVGWTARKKEKRHDDNR